LQPPSSSVRHRWPGYQAVQQRYTYAQPRPGATFGIQRHVDAELLDYVRVEPDLSLLSATRR